MRWLVTVIICITVSLAHAQSKGPRAVEPISYPEVEDSSYYYWYYSMHAQQVALGKKAANNQINYYYLNYRLGIAFRERGDHKRSLKYFAKAIRQSAGDRSLYLQAAYSAYYLGYDEEVRYLQGMMETSAKQNVKYHSFEPISGAYAEGGFKRSSKVAIGDMRYGHAGVKSSIGRKFSIYNGYSKVTQENYWGDVNQDQYYGLAAFKASLTCSFRVGFHYLNANVDPANDVPLVIPNYAWAGSATFSSGRVDVTPSFYYGQLNNKEQLQPGIQLSIQPYGNDKLAFGAYAAFHTVPGIYTTDRTISGNGTPILRPFVTLRLIPRLWINAEYLYVNMTDFIENDAFLTNNSIDKTVDRTSLLLNYRLSDHWSFIGMYQYERKEEIEPFLNGNSYYFNTILAGIKFNL